MKKILGFLLFIILMIGCTDMVLNPDIEVVRISPLGFYIIDAVEVLQIDTIVFAARNSQDAHITEFFYEFYDFNDNLIYASEEPFPMSVSVPGIVDPACACTTKIMGLLVRTDTLSSYIFNNNLLSAKIKYIFVSEADYFSDRTDTTEIVNGLYRLKVIYLTNLTSNVDSIPRDGGLSAATITATCQDFAGNPVIGARLEFSTTDGSLSAMYGYTSCEGTASVLLFSDTGGVPIWVWVTVNHPYASHSITIPVKFYIPGEEP